MILKLNPTGFVHISEAGKTLCEGSNSINVAEFILLLTKQLAQATNKVAFIRFLNNSAILGTVAVTYDNEDVKSTTFDATTSPTLFTGEYDELHLLSDTSTIIAEFIPPTPLTKASGVPVSVSWKISLTA